MAGGFLDNKLIQILTQLAMMSPLLLVYAGGIVLGFMSLEKHRQSARLLIVGLLIVLGVSVAHPFMIFAIIEANQNGQLFGVRMDHVISAFIFAQNLLHAL